MKTGPRPPREESSSRCPAPRRIHQLHNGTRSPGTGMAPKRGRAGRFPDRYVFSFTSSHLATSRGIPTFITSRPCASHLKERVSMGRRGPIRARGSLWTARRDPPSRIWGRATRLRGGSRPPLRRGLAAADALRRRRRAEGKRHLMVPLRGYPSRCAARHVIIPRDK